MKISNLLFVLLLVCLVVRADEDSESSSNGNDAEEDETPKSCYKYSTDFLLSSTTTILKCLGSKFKPKNIFEYVTRSWCILKCVLQELGTVTQEGYFDDIAAAFFFEENFAPEVRESLLPNVQACFAFSEKFDPKEYYCKTYEPFISCLVRALVPALLPYSINCYTNPILATVLDALRNWAPDPVLQAEAREWQRQLRKNPKVQCINKGCSRKYKIQKINGTSTLILYDKNMTEISRTVKKPKGNEFLIEFSL